MFERRLNVREGGAGWFYAPADWLTDWQMHESTIECSQLTRGVGDSTIFQLILSVSVLLP